MVDYPALQEMGIARCNEISHYTLRQEGVAKDVLKIYYEREKGSFLPISRKYKFGRATKTVRVASGNSGTQDVHEISPFLRKALAELDSLVAQRQAGVNEKEQLLAEIDHLQHTVASKCDELKARVARL